MSVIRSWARKQIEIWKTNNYSESFAGLGLMALGALFGVIFAETFGLIPIAMGSFCIALICCMAILILGSLKRRKSE
jgi:hypothetical protein